MKTVLVSGGTRGIGRAIVTAFAESGCRVFFLYNKSDALARELEASLGAVGIKCDVSDAEQVKKAVEIAGDVDVLVNNAGISSIGLFTDLSDSEWRRVIDINLSSAFYLSRAVAPSMINKKCGRIINIGSMWGKTGASCEVAYSATKAGLRGFTMSLAKELGPSGITVNCIEPGVIDTEMNASLGEDAIDALVDETPLCRIGDPADVANAALFLASNGASFITGQTIGVDGGYAI